MRQASNIIAIIGDSFLSETADKELQDSTCRGSGGVPQLKKSPKTGGFRGLMETITAVSIG